MLEYIIHVGSMRDISNTEVAQILHLSERQLSRLVQKYYGTTLRQVIINKRIEAAEQMLISTNLSIEKIALSIGFSTITCFYREFQKNIPLLQQITEKYIQTNPVLSLKVHSKRI